MKPSLATTMFEHIRSMMSDGERVQFLEQLIADAKPEEDHLEFKCGLENGKSLPNEKVRELYGKAVSAFANSSGGIVLWGIQTKPDQSLGVDRANSIAPVPQVGQLCALLDQYQRDVTDPPVFGAKNLPISKSGDSGFVVSLIPESRHKPHAYRRSKDEELYYVRVASHSLPARQSTLRRLFFPEFHSRLELLFETQFTTPPSIRTMMWVRNKGPGTAEEVSILFKTHLVDPEGGIRASWEEIETSFPRKGTQYPAVFYRAKRSIHPGEILAVCSFHIKRDKDLERVQGVTKKLDAYEFRLFTRNEPPMEVSFELRTDHIGQGTQVGVVHEKD